MTEKDTLERASLREKVLKEINETELQALDLKKNTLKFLCSKNYLDKMYNNNYMYGVYDLRPLHKNFKIYDEPITEELIRQKYQDFKFGGELNGHNLGLLGAIAFPEFEGTYGHMSYPLNSKINEPYVFTTTGDGYFNIKVHNATYAFLRCGYNTGINMDVNLDKMQDGTFGFIDVTQYNPLRAVQACHLLRLFTDGSTLEYDALYFQSNPRRLLYEFNKYDMRALTWFESKNLVMMMGFHENHLLKIDELVEVKDKSLFPDEIPKVSESEPIKTEILSDSQLDTTNNKSLIGSFVSYLGSFIY